MAHVIVIATLLLQQPDPERDTRQRLTRAAGALSVYRDLHGEWPATLEPAAKLLKGDAARDGWGRPFVYSMNRELTDEDRKKFEGAVADLASDDLQVREDASKAIEGMGSAVAGLVKAELDRTKIEEVKGRLATLLKRLTAAPPSVTSLGADGKAGGEGADADLSVTAPTPSWLVEDQAKESALRVATAAAAVETYIAHRGWPARRMADLVGDGLLAEEDAREVRYDALEGYWRIGLRPKDGAPICAYYFDLTKVNARKNDLLAIQSLKTITVAQADFRSNDRDGNLVNDFWVADVSSLFRILPADGAASLVEPAKGAERIRLIEEKVARGDAAPLPEGGIVGKELCPLPEPYSGYLFRVLKRDKDGGYAQDTDGTKRKWQCRSRFGVCAYPVVYGVTGRLTFYVGADNTLFRKDTGGRPLAEEPANPAEQGWSVVD